MTEVLEAYAAAKVRAALGWQPIETAPDIKGDYFFCLLAWGPEGDQSVGGGFRWRGSWFAAGTFHCIGRDRLYELRDVVVKPTHWRPGFPPPQHDNE